jgi:hypothetical protein
MLSRNLIVTNSTGKGNFRKKIRHCTAYSLLEVLHIIIKSTDIKDLEYIFIYEYFDFSMESNVDTVEPICGVNVLARKLG